MALGGAAATKFASKGGSGGGAYQDGDFSYKTSQDVRDYYFKQIESASGASACVAEGSVDTALPIGWRAREKEREIIAKQQGVFAARSPSGAGKNCSEPCTSVKASSGGTISGQAHIALLQVTTNSLEALASVLESDDGTSLPVEERSKFASAMKRAMDALAKCR